jgi:hypothetical protein
LGAQRSGEIRTPMSPHDRQERVMAAVVSVAFGSFRPEEEQWLWVENNAFMHYHGW